MLWDADGVYGMPCDGLHVLPCLCSQLTMMTRPCQHLKVLSYPIATSQGLPAGTPTPAP